MSAKKYVTNVCTCTLLDASGSWTLNGGYPLQPDEIVVRQITFNGSGPSKNTELMLITSNISSGVTLGSICNIPGFTSNPGTVITPTGPLPQVITFQLMYPIIGSSPASPDVADLICVHMDFINYR